VFSAVAGELVRDDVPLAQHCRLRIGGHARFFAEPKTVQELCVLCSEAHAKGIQVRILGGGSNVLVRSGGVDGLVIRLVGSLAKIETFETRLVTGGGATLGDAISTSAAAGLAGLEHLAGIPGSLGGAIVSNSGVTNDDIGSHVQLVRAVGRDGTVVELGRDALQFGFRRSNLEDYIVTDAEFELEPADAGEVTRRLQSAWIVKKATQPPAGASVIQAFIEPTGSNLADLLDAAGMRSASEGDAAMSSQYPGFLVVNEKTDPDQVLALCSRIARAVEVQSGIQLQSQLKIW